jgi:hypothetical protein
MTAPLTSSQGADANQANRLVWRASLGSWMMARLHYPRLAGLVQRTVIVAVLRPPSATLAIVPGLMRLLPDDR